MADATVDNLTGQRLPRVRYQGGPFLRHPRIVTITFTHDDPPIVGRLERFGDLITRTEWWRTVTDAYCTEAGDCVGDGRPGRPARLDEPLADTVSDGDVEALLRRTAAANRFGPLDADTLLLVYLPQAVILSDAVEPRYCSGGARALHRALRLPRITLPYAVVPRCGDEADITAAASHEILEAATNPDPAARGFAMDRDSAHLGFTIAGVEPVDACGLITMDRHRAVESGFVVQRAWSNREASLGHDPCVPTPSGRPFLALVPRQPTVRLAYENASTTILLDADANQAALGWSVSAIELTGRHGQRYLDVSLDRAQVARGDTATLSITVRRPNPDGVAVVGVVSTFDGHTFLWPVAVVMR